MAKATALENKKLEMELNGFTLRSDLPKTWGGDNAYPGPLDLLQFALLACAATHALMFTDKLGLNRKDVTTELEPVFGENGDIVEAAILVYVPNNFPADKEAALIGAVQNCVVGRHVKFPRKVIVVRQ